MNGLIPVEFDGKVFVPLGPVSLPVGAKCGVEVSPIARSNASPVPPPLTPEDRMEWDRIIAEIRQNGVPWRTVEEARPAALPVMILLDADVMLIDLGVQPDRRAPVNRAALIGIPATGETLGVVTQGLLETVGKASYGTRQADIARLPSLLIRQYGLIVIPATTAGHPVYSGCDYDEILATITKKMSLGDATMAAQIEKYAPDATALLTWNAKHFVGKLPVPVLTPTDWLAANSPPPSGTTGS